MMHDRTLDSDSYRRNLAVYNVRADLRALVAAAAAAVTGDQSVSFVLACLMLIDKPTTTT